MSRSISELYQNIVDGNVSDAEKSTLFEDVFQTFIDAGLSHDQLQTIFDDARMEAAQNENKDWLQEGFDRAIQTISDQLNDNAPDVDMPRANDQETQIAEQSPDLSSAYDGENATTDFSFDSVDNESSNNDATSDHTEEHESRVIHEASDDYKHSQEIEGCLRNIFDNDEDKISATWEKLDEIYNGDSDKVYDAVSFAVNFKDPTVSDDSQPSKVDSLNNRMEYDQAKEKYAESRGKYNFRNTFAVMDRLKLDIAAYKTGMPGANGEPVSGGRLAMDFLELSRSNIFESLIEMGIRAWADAKFPPKVETEKPDVAKDASPDTTTDTAKSESSTNAVEKNEVDIKDNGKVDEPISRDVDMRAVRNENPAAGMYYGADMRFTPQDVKTPRGEVIQGEKIWSTGRNTVEIGYKDGKEIEAHIPAMRVYETGGNTYLVDAFGKAYDLDTPNAKTSEIMTGKEMYVDRLNLGRSIDTGAIGDKQGISADQAKEGIRESQMERYITSALSRMDKHEGFLTKESTSLTQNKEAAIANKESFEKRIDSLKSEIATEKEKSSPDTEKITTLEGKLVETEGAHKAVTKEISAIDARQGKISATLERYNDAKTTCGIENLSTEQKLRAVINGERNGVGRGIEKPEMLSKDDKNLVEKVNSEIVKEKIDEIESGKDAVTQEFPNDIDKEPEVDIEQETDIEPNIGLDDDISPDDIEISDDIDLLEDNEPFDNINSADDVEPINDIELQESNALFDDDVSLKETPNDIEKSDTNETDSIETTFAAHEDKPVQEVEQKPSNNGNSKATIIEKGNQSSASQSSLSKEDLIYQPELDKYLDALEQSYEKVLDCSSELTDIESKISSLESNIQYLERAGNIDIPEEQIDDFKDELSYLQELKDDLTQELEAHNPAASLYEELNTKDATAKELVELAREKGGEAGLSKEEMESFRVEQPESSDIDKELDKQSQLDNEKQDEPKDVSKDEDKELKIEQGDNKDLLDNSDKLNEIEQSNHEDGQDSATKDEEETEKDIIANEGAEEQVETEPQNDIEKPEDKPEDLEKNHEEKPEKDVDANKPENDNNVDKPEKDSDADKDKQEDTDKDKDKEDIDKDKQDDIKQNDVEKPEDENEDKVEASNGNETEIIESNDIGNGEDNIAVDQGLEQIDAQNDLAKDTTEEVPDVDSDDKKVEDALLTSDETENDRIEDLADKFEEIMDDPATTIDINDLLEEYSPQEVIEALGLVEKDEDDDSDKDAVASDDDKEDDTNSKGSFDDLLDMLSDGISNKIEDIGEWMDAFSDAINGDSSGLEDKILDSLMDRIESNLSFADEIASIINDHFGATPEDRVGVNDIADNLENMGFDADTVSRAVDIGDMLNNIMEGFSNLFGGGVESEIPNVDVTPPETPDVTSDNMPDFTPDFTPDVSPDDFADDGVFDSFADNFASDVGFDAAEGAEATEGAEAAEEIAEVIAALL